MKNYNVYNVLDHINQYCIIDGSKKIFKSYNSICAIYDSKKSILTLGIDRDYSKTTLKHLYSFLNDCNYRFNCVNKKELQKAIDSGEYNGVKIKYNKNIQ